MARKSALVAALLLAIPSPLLAGPDLFGEDKLKHFFASFFVASASASLGRSLGLEPEEAAWVGAGTAVGAGLVKEWLDLRGARPGGGTAEATDLVWGALGAGAGALLLREAR